METARIAELLRPFLTAQTKEDKGDLSFHAGSSPEESAGLSESQLLAVSTYLDLLLRWNARFNLTAVRAPEEIVTRHFGESLFAARHLFPGPSPVVLKHPRIRPGSALSEVEKSSSQQGSGVAAGQAPHLIDIGSGAGFPGLPIKIWAPELQLTLIESNQKKAIFLREVARSLTLTNVNVITRRAEDVEFFDSATVTLRAVERFERVLPTALRLAGPGGRLALLIGQAQVPAADEFDGIRWDAALPIPLSQSRVLLVGELIAQLS